VPDQLKDFPTPEPGPPTYEEMLAFNQYVQPKRALALLLATAFTAPEDWAHQWTDYNATPKPMGSKRQATAIKVSSFSTSLSRLSLKHSLTGSLQM
jgi:hypothetical protein